MKMEHRLFPLRMRMEKIFPIYFYFLLLTGFIKATAQGSTSLPSTSLQEFWIHQFNHGEKIDSVVLGVDDSGKAQKILVKITQSLIGGDKPDSYFDNHPAWQQKIVSFSIDDGKKMSEKIYTTQGDNNEVFLSPKGDIWSYSWHQNKKQKVEGIIEKTDGSKINLAFDGTLPGERMDFSSKGTFAFLLGDPGWAIRDENGNVVKDENTGVSAFNISDNEKFIAIKIPNHKRGNQLALINNVGKELFRLPIAKETFVSSAFSTDGSQFAFTTSAHLFITDKNGLIIAQKPYRFKIAVCFIDNENILMTDKSHIWIENISNGEKPFKTSFSEILKFIKMVSNNIVLLKYDRLDALTNHHQSGIELIDLSGKSLLLQSLAFSPTDGFIKNNMMFIWGTNGTNYMLKVFKFIQ